MNAQLRSASRRFVWHFGKAALPLCVALFVTSACAPKKSPTTHPAADDSNAMVPGSFEADALAAAVSALQQSADALPGRTPEAHRTTMAEAFASINQALALLEGAEPSMAFTSQSRSLDMARQRLANNERAEQAIDMGLRATHAAFRRLARSEELADPSLDPLLDRLDNSVDRYGQTPSVGKAYVAADAIRTTAQIARAMADNIAPTQAPEPTVEPAVTDAVPATAPAEELPATAPSSEAAPAEESAPVVQPTEPPAAAEQTAPAAAPAEDLNK